MTPETPNEHQGGAQAQPDAPGATPAAPAPPSLVAVAQGPSSTFAIGVFGSRDGQGCVVAGRVRNRGALGATGRFPALAGEERLCARSSERMALYGARTFDGEDLPTTMVFGRAPAGDRTVTVRSPAGTHTAPTGPGWRVPPDLRGHRRPRPPHRLDGRTGHSGSVAGRAVLRRLVTTSAIARLKG